MKDIQSRRWQITINNHQEKGHTREVVIRKLQQLSTIYFCLAEEIGDEGTVHIHIYVVTRGGLRFSTLQKMFDGQAHFEKIIRSSSRENRDYIAKEGIWAGTDKAKTRIEGSFFEEGELPDDSNARTERDDEMLQIIEEFKEGRTIMEVILSHPRIALRSRELAQLQKRCICEKALKEKRDVKIKYIYGNDAEKLLDLVYKKHKFEDVCRIVNYHVGKQISFDVYDYQPVIVFCNFNGQIPLKELCDYCGCYPVFLPSRFEDKVACFTDVYILSDVPPVKLYLGESKSEKSAKANLLNKLESVIEVKDDGVLVETDLKEEVIDDGKRKRLNPFEE